MQDTVRTWFLLFSFELSVIAAFGFYLAGDGFNPAGVSFPTSSTNISYNERQTGSNFKRKFILISFFVGPCQCFFTLYFRGCETLLMVKCETCRSRDMNIDQSRWLSQYVLHFTISHFCISQNTHYQIWAIEAMKIVWWADMTSISDFVWSMEHMDKQQETSIFNTTRLMYRILAHITRALCAILQTTHAPCALYTCARYMIRFKFARTWSLLIFSKCFISDVCSKYGPYFWKKEDENRFLTSQTYIFVLIELNFQSLKTLNFICLSCIV